MSVQSFVPDVNAGPDIGSALKAAREFKGLTLDAVAESTRIRRSYLAAIEDMRLDDLPSRPFTVGFIRAYAEMLDMDSEAAAERFKADQPELETALRAPIGVDDENDPRLTLVVTSGILIIGAIILWNVAQRAMSDQAPPPPTAPAAAIAAAKPAPAGPVSLGAPLPAPVESTTPTPYETPGLAEATAAGGSSDAVEDAKKLRALNPDLQPVVPAEPLPPTFVAKGAVHGAPESASVVTLQARKAASLVVRGADGSVYFARQLSAGEAFRAPLVKGLTLDVSDPAAFQVFVGGASRGLLPAPQTPVERLAAAQ